MFKPLLIVSVISCDMYTYSTGSLIRITFLPRPELRVGGSLCCKLTTNSSYLDFSSVPPPSRFWFGSLGHSVFTSLSTFVKHFLPHESTHLVTIFQFTLLLTLYESRKLLCL